MRRLPVASSANPGSLLRSWNWAPNVSRISLKHSSIETQLQYYRTSRIPHTGRGDAEKFVCCRLRSSSPIMSTPSRRESGIRWCSEVYLIRILSYGAHFRRKTPLTGLMDGKTFFLQSCCYVLRNINVCLSASHLRCDRNEHIARKIPERRADVNPQIFAQTPFAVSFHSRTRMFAQMCVANFRNA